jgi:hypothetical protein
MAQAPDSKPGNYYVSCVDGQHVGRLVGPFLNDHSGALAMVDKARDKAQELDPRAAFYAFGTIRVDLDVPPKPGVLNSYFGMAS